MRAPIAISISTVVHAGLIAGMALWGLTAVDSHVEYTVLRGEPITVQWASPAAAPAVEIEMPPEPEPPKPEPPPPPLEIESTPVPTETALAEVTPVVEIARDPTQQVVERAETAEPPPSMNQPAETVAVARPRPEPEVDVEPVQSPRVPVQKQVAQPQPSAAMAAVQPLVVGAEVDTLPTKMPTNRPPNYPVEELLAGIQGRVLLRVLVLSDGSVAELSVDATSGSANLDSAALEAVRAWRFTPARRRGTAVAHEVIVPVRFSIRRG